MDTLFTLVTLVSFDQLQPHIPVGCKPKEAARWRSFHQLLSTQPDLEEGEAVRLLYGNSRSANYPPFVALQAAFEWACLQAFLTPVYEGNKMSRASAQSYCWQGLALANMLRTHAKLKEVLLPIIKIAKEHDLMNTQLEAAMMLHSYYVFAALDVDKSEENIELAKNLAAVQRMVDTCKAAYYDFRHRTSQEQLDKGDLQSFLAKVHPEIAATVEEVQFYDVQYFGGLFLVQSTLWMEDYPAALSWADKIRLFFRRYFAAERGLQQQLCYFQLQACIGLLNYEQGAKILEELALLLQEDTQQPDQNARLMEAHIILCLRTAQRTAATDLIAQINESIQQRQLPKSYFPQYLLYVQQLSCLLRSEARLLTLPLNEQVTDCERLLMKSSSIEQMTEVGKWNFYLVQATSAVQQKNYKAATQYLQTLVPELPKRLKRDHPLYRLHIFAQLLETTAKANFHRAATLRKTATLSKKLAETKARIDEEALENELLPFQWLWQEVQQHLSMKVPNKPYWQKTK